jgi:methylphosphotriester-DNA--protein-cysteine methyltransferase
MPKLHSSSPDVPETKPTLTNLKQVRPLSWHQIRAKVRANCTPAARRLEEFLDRVDIFYKEKNPVSFCVGPLPINKDYLRQLCKKISGQTPMQCVGSRLVFEAIRLLSEGELSIEEVAWEVGCSSHSQLDHIFKKYTGVTPSQYRKHLLENEQTLI